MTSPALAHKPTPSGSLRRLVALLLLLPALGACGDGTVTGPDHDELEIVIVQGDGQASGPRSLLPLPLLVRVQNRTTGRAAADVRIRWEIVDGAGATLDSPSSATDTSGLASARLTLGPDLGPYRVQASVQGRQTVPVEFRADAVLVPELSSVPSSAVHAGDTIVLEGRNFSAYADKNVVTFSGIRGRVLAVQPLSLTVEVPPCLPERTVGVRIRLGALTSAELSLAVAGAPNPLVLAPGEDTVLDASQGFACGHLPSEPQTRYLVVPHSTGTVGGAVYDVGVVGLTTDNQAPFSVPSEAAPSRFQRRPEGREAAMRLRRSAREEWDERLRRLEAEAVLRASATHGPPIAPRASSAPSPSAPPSVGDRRTFKVLNRDNAFDEVTGTLRLVSKHSLVYVDDASPPKGFTASDLTQLAMEWESPIHSTVTETFGEESDLDGNGRVIVLLTPAVNRLTEPGSDGIVGGFFFGIDLLPGESGSNQGEIFYALVPDPTGSEGPPLSRSIVLRTISPVLAHEFEHMIHFNQRILVSGAAGQDALWLSEALAQMAEDRVGDAFEAVSDLSKAYDFRVGNWDRARRFLLDPGQVSVLASLPPGTLAERGAGWLLLKHLSGQPALEGLLSSLVKSTRTGVTNLTGAVGKSWEDILAEWVGAMYLDGTTVPVRPELRIAGVNLRNALAIFDGTFPLQPPELGGSTFSYSGTLWSSAPEYFVIVPPSAGGVAVSASGPAGFPPEAGMGLQLLIVRLQ